MPPSLSTRTKLQELGKYLTRHHLRLRGIDAENICGFGIGRKIKDGKPQRFYSLVFHVAKKVETKDLSKRKTIPKQLSIRLPKLGTIKIPTDVIETGEFKLQFGIGALVNIINATKGGSIGLFLQDQFQNVYALTNYHVLGESLIQNKIFQYTTPDLNTQDTQLDGLANVNFFCGVMDSQNDAALVFINNNALQAMSTPPNTVNGQPISNIPATSYAVGDQVAVFGRIDFNVASNIDQLACVQYDPDTGVQLTGLISFGKITQPGDSGSLLLLIGSSVMPVGLVVGANSVNSFAIPLTTTLAALAKQAQLSLTII